MCDRKSPKTLDHLEQAVTFLFFDNVAEQVPQRTDVAAQRLLSDFRGYTRQLVQPLIDPPLIERVHPLQLWRDALVDVPHGIQDAFLAVPLRIAVTQLDGFVLTGRSAGRHGRATARAAHQGHISFNGRITARVQNFARVNLIYLGHRSWPETLSPRLILREVQ